MESDTRAQRQHSTNPYDGPTDQAHLRALGLQDVNDRGATPHRSVTIVWHHQYSGQESATRQASSWVHESAPTARGDAHLI